MEMGLKLLRSIKKKVSTKNRSIATAKYSQYIQSILPYFNLKSKNNTHTHFSEIQNNVLKFLTPILSKTK